MKGFFGGPATIIRVDEIDGLVRGETGLVPVDGFLEWRPLLFVETTRIINENFGVNLLLYFFHISVLLPVVTNYMLPISKDHTDCVTIDVA